MEKINFKTSINAPKEKVWNVLWDDASYREWTSAFHEGSYAETDNWTEGTEVKFLGPSGDGMVSKVAENRPNEYMSFEHLGMIMNGKEDRDGEKVKEWAGAKENYTLKETNSVTELAIDMDISDEYKDMFSQMWPKALEKVKALAEKINKTDNYGNKNFCQSAGKRPRKMKGVFHTIRIFINPQFTDETAACVVFSKDIYAMILTHEKFAQFTKRQIADASKTTEVITALSAESKQQVDELFNKAMEAGATPARDTEDHGFMYLRSFNDPDDHIWEVFWMDPSFAQQPQTAEANSTN